MIKPTPAANALACRSGTQPSEKHAGLLSKAQLVYPSYIQLLAPFLTATLLVTVAQPLVS